jgi:6-phosphogluconolactonase
MDWNRSYTVFKPRVRIFDTLDSLNLDAVSNFLDVVKKAVVDRGIAFVALSGGSTPQGLYRLLAQPVYRDSIPWTSILFFWCDERCVPPDHPESNYGQAKDILLNHVPIRPENIHRMRGELTPQDAVSDYVNVLAKHGEDRQPWPTLDWVLLGMGAEGHTASLFPGQINLEEKTSPVIAVTANYEGRPANRVTLTPMVFNTSRNVIFLVTGENKAPVLSSVLNGPHNPLTFPAQRIKPANGTITWWVDTLAAKLITNENQNNQQ